jgi:hypothetical protein
MEQPSPQHILVSIGTTLVHSYVDGLVLNIKNQILEGIANVVGHT